MSKFKIICPDCGAALIAGSLEDVLWEPCPGCGRHIWDGYDMLLADECASGSCDVARGDSGLYA